MSLTTNIIPNTSIFFYQTVSFLRQKSHYIYQDASESFQFLLGFFQDPFTNGSIFPSSRELTEKIIKFIPQKSEDTSKNRYFLEVGPGNTGPITKKIIDICLKENDQFDVIELNPSYCKTLREKFAAYKNVHIHCLSITEWNPDYQYDAVISGLPLNGFTPELVQKCINVFKKVTKIGGTVSYFDYPIFPKIFVHIYWGKRKKEYLQLLEIKELFFKTYGIDSELAKNFPTANVQHFKMKEIHEATNEKTTPIQSLSDAS